jgi:hypothetical protein
LNFSRSKTKGHIRRIGMLRLLLFIFIMLLLPPLLLL